MSVMASGEKPLPTKENIVSFVLKFNKPYVTVTDVTNAHARGSKHINNRLNELAEDGILVKERVGASAAVWYHPDRA